LTRFSLKRLTQGAPFPWGDRTTYTENDNMPSLTTCPRCKRKLKIGDNAVGTNIKCPGCAHVFKATVLPGAPKSIAASVEPAEQDILDVVPNATTQPKEKKSNALLYGCLTGLFVVLLLVGLGIAGVYYLINKTTNAVKDWAAEVTSEKAPDKAREPDNKRPGQPGPDKPPQKGLNAAALDAEIAASGGGVKLVKLDLSSAGLPLTIEAPEGATAQKASNFVGVMVAYGDHFCLYIAVGRDDMDKRKELQGKFGMKTVAVSPDRLLLEGGDRGNPEYKCAVNVSTGYREYCVENLERDDAKRIHHTKNDCLLMMKCSRTLALKVPLPNDPVAALKQLHIDIRPDENGQITEAFPGQGITDSTLQLVTKLPDLRKLVAGYYIHDDGLAHLSRCIHLKHLDLSDAKITDVGLKHLSGLTALEELYLPDASLPLGNEKITGAGLAQLVGLGKLHTLSLHGTKIDDAALSNLKALTSLKSLDLSSTSVTGTGLASLKTLTNLLQLRLRNAKVTDAGLPAMSGLSSLEYLVLSETEITGEGLTSLKDLHKLKTLYLERIEKFNDKGVAEIGKATSLESLSLRGTPITDDSLVHLKGLKQLKTLDLKYTKVTEKGARELKEALPEVKIEHGSS
jgi:hypothetical protein